LSAFATPRPRTTGLIADASRPLIEMAEGMDCAANPTETIPTAIKTQPDRAFRTGPVVEYLKRGLPCGGVTGGTAIGRGVDALDELSCRLVDSCMAAFQSPGEIENRQSTKSSLSCPKIRTDRPRTSWSSERREIYVLSLPCGIRPATCYKDEPVCVSENREPDSPSWRKVSACGKLRDCCIAS